MRKGKRKDEKRKKRRTGKKILYKKGITFKKRKKENEKPKDIKSFKLKVKKSSKETIFS